MFDTVKITLLKHTLKRHSGFCMNYINFPHLILSSSLFTVDKRVAAGDTILRTC